jgi:NADH:ubiquinone oxidoreductase subunit D
MMCNEQAYSLAVEKLLNIDVPLRAKYIRSTCCDALSEFVLPKVWEHVRVAANISVVFERAVDVSPLD